MQTESKPIFTDCAEIQKDDQGRKQINQYLFLETIGKGAFSKIKKCVVQENGTEHVLAVKIINKDSLVRQRAVRYAADGNPIMLNNLDKIYEEIDVWRNLNHPNIVSLYEVIDDEEHSKLFMIMEYADLGQISEYEENEVKYLQRKEIVDFVIENHFKEQKSATHLQKVELTAKWVFSQVLEAVEYLHSNNIIHRDIKLDNILVSSQDGGVVKLCDFTVSKQLESAEEICYDCEGTPFYTSPEVSFCGKEGYTPRPIDIWSIGVCIYAYLTEDLPFNGDSDIEVQIATKDKEFKVETWMSEDLKEVLSKTLDKDPQKRPTVGELKKFKWFHL